MLKNISLRHFIPLMFFSGSLLLLIFFYLIGLPAAKNQAVDLSQRETRSLLLAQQSRFIDLLIKNDPKKINMEIFFTNSNPMIESMSIVDARQKILFSSRSRFVGKNLSEIGIPVGNIQIPFPEEGNLDISVEKQPGSDTLLNGYASLRFLRDETEFNLTLIVVRDYSALAKAVSDVAAKPSEILATVMVLFALFAVLLFRQHLNKRLRPLLKVAGKLALGDTSARAALKGADEFAEIGRSFDQMAEKLEQHHAELEDAKNLAEKANLAKNNFLSSLSNEIQTPLSGLMGFIDLLGSTRLDEEGRLYVRSADSAARTLSGLMNDLVETSRLEAGHTTLSTEVFCLNALLQEIIDSILPRALLKGLSIKVECLDNNPIWIESDPRVFRQILVHLIGNAVQFTEEGQITIRISATPTGGTHIALSIDVIDTGIGIRKDEFGKLFDRFYKSNDPRVQASPGSGVGLAICKELADLLGGKIAVKSVLNEGSSFSLSMEVTGAEQPSDFNYSVLAQREQKPQNILLVEHSDITRTLMRSILEKWGHTVLPCKSSESAVTEMKECLIYPSKPAILLVVMDLNMPGMNGFEAAAEIRGLDSCFQSLPILATSTQTDKQTEDNCHDAGFDGFIGKPIDMKKMADEVFRLTRLADDRPDKNFTIETFINLTR